MNNIPETGNLHKLNHENVNTQIFSKEIQSVIRNLAANQGPGIDGFTGEFHRMLMKNRNPSQTFPKFLTLFIMLALT